MSFLINSFLRFVHNFQGYTACLFTKLLKIFKKTNKKTEIDAVLKLNK